MRKTSLQVFPQFKDVYFFFYWLAFNSDMSIAPVVYIRELRNSVLPMLFHGWKCERRAFDFYPYFHNSKMLFFLLTGLQFKHLHNLHSHGNDNLSYERQYGTWNILREGETIIINWIWLNGLKLQVIADLRSSMLSKISTKTSTTILFHFTVYLSLI